jgi:hypothetical protein
MRAQLYYFLRQDLNLLMAHSDYEEGYCGQFWPVNSLNGSGSP